jgi:hypothetical protein
MGAGSLAQALKSIKGTTSIADAPAPEKKEAPKEKAKEVAKVEAKAEKPKEAAKVEPKKEQPKVEAKKEEPKEEAPPAFEAIAIKSKDRNIIIDTPAKSDDLVDQQLGMGT